MVDEPIAMAGGMLQPPGAHEDAKKPDDVDPLTQEPMLQFFTFDHLIVELQDISEPFRNLAHQIVLALPRNPERTTALRKLLEAKDCAVRARLYK